MIDLREKLWDEKPMTSVITMQWKEGVEKHPVIIYEAVKMDDWLEKLKTQWDRERKATDMIDDQIGQAQVEIGQMTAKLEAIKKFHKETLHDEVWSEWSEKEYAKEALKILEGK